MHKSTLKGWMFVGLGFVMLIPFIAANAVIIYCSYQPPGGTKPRIEQLENGIVVFDAPIDDQTASSMVDLLRHPRLPITKIGLNSYGGFGNASERIATTIKQMPAVPILVPANGVCESACVQILAASPNTLELAPTAKVMFHAAAGRASLSDCWACRQLNKFSVWLSMRLPWHDNQAMLPWATALSPQLPALFNLCPLNPLETQVGITLSGDEVNALRTGKVRPEQLIHLCPSTA